MRADGTPCCSDPALGGRNHRATFHPRPDMPAGLRRCVGAFRRPCLILTDAILCPACWAVIDAAALAEVASLHGLSRMVGERYWMTNAGARATGPLGLIREGRRG